MIDRIEFLKREIEKIETGAKRKKDGTLLKSDQRKLELLKAELKKYSDWIKFSEIKRKELELF